MQKGKYLHEAVKLCLSDNLDRKSLDPQLQPLLWAFEKFLVDTKFEVSGSEEPMYCPQYRYAGTPDLWGLWDGKLVLVDIKSGSFAKWHPIQLAAYSHLLDANGIETRGGVDLYLKDTSYSLKSFTVGELREGLSIFLSCLTVWKWREVNLYDRARNNARNY
jgi:hypothetical protein